MPRKSLDGGQAEGYNAPHESGKKSPPVEELPGCGGGSPRKKPAHGSAGKTEPDKRKSEVAGAPKQGRRVKIA